MESAFVNHLGFEIIGSSEVRNDAFLFGESPSRIVVSVTEVGEDMFLDKMHSSNVPFMLLGHVTKGRIVVDDQKFGYIDEYKKIYEEALSNKLDK